MCDGMLCCLIDEERKFDFLGVVLKISFQATVRQSRGSPDQMGLRNISASDAIE